MLLTYTYKYTYIQRSPLAGGCHTVLLSGEEANKRKDKQKSVLMRMHEPMFGESYVCVVCIYVCLYVCVYIER